MAKEKKKAGKKGDDHEGKSKAKKARKAKGEGGAIERFRAAALKIKAERVQPCAGDVRAAAANVQQGVAAVFGAPDDADRKRNVAAIKEALPELSVKKVLELPDLAEALISAVSAVTPEAAVDGEAKKSDAADLRDRLWTLLVERHGDLRVMGYYRFRDDFEASTPKLSAPVAEAKGAEAPAASAPEAASDGASAPEAANGDGSPAS